MQNKTIKTNTTEQKLWITTKTIEIKKAWKITYIQSSKN